MSNATHAPSPALIFDTFGAYQRTASLKAAIEIELFTAIGEGAHTVPALAARCVASERGIRILCDFLTVAGFLIKSGREYSLTPDSAVFLDRRSPAYMGGVAEFLLSDTVTSSFADVAAIVRKGGTVLPEAGSVAPDHPMWVKFARAMQPMMAPPSQAIPKLIHANPSGKLKVLDIAASHGLFGLAFAQHNPQAEIVGLDWSNVLAVAKENAAKAGVADRYRTIEGSAFTMEYGTGYDIVLLVNFLHHFDVETCETLLRKVHAALADDGRAVTMDFVPNADRVSPPMPATFSMMMLGTTPSGDAYTFLELESMFRNSGFSRSEIHPLPQTFSSVVVSYK